MFWLIWQLAGCGGPSTPVLQPPELDDEAQLPALPAQGDQSSASGTTNRPPQIKDILFQPEHPRKGDTIETRVLGSDPEHDQVSIELVWVVNGQRWLDQTGRSLSGDQLKRGDRVQVEATVSDGTSSVTQLSKTLIVGNTPPELQTKAAAFADINGLQVQATDVDGDTLSYRLEGAPDGLTIDSRGVITYVGSESAQAGTYKVTLVVDDNAGGTAKLTFGMGVSAGQSERRVKKGSEEAAEGSAAPPG